MRNVITSKESLRQALSWMSRIMLAIKLTSIIALYIYIVVIFASNSLVIYDYIALLVLLVVFLSLILIRRYNHVVLELRLKGVLLFITIPILSTCILLNEKRNTKNLMDREIFAWKRSVLIVQYLSLITYIPFLWIHYLISRYYLDILFLNQSFTPSSFIQLIIMSFILGTVIIWPFATMSLIVYSIIKTHKEDYNSVMILNLLSALTSIWTSLHVPMLLANVYSIMKSTKELD